MDQTPEAVSSERLPPDPDTMEFSAGLVIGLIIGSVIGLTVKRAHQEGTDRTGQHAGRRIRAALKARDSRRR